MEDLDLNTVFRELFSSFYAIYDGGSITAEQLNALIAQTTNLERQVEQLSLFSDNETLEEINSSHLKFFVVPAILGYFLTRDTSDKRLESLQHSQKKLASYLEKCRLYGFPSASLIPPTPSSTAASSASTDQKLLMGAVDRNQKIANFKRTKVLAQNIKLLSFEKHHYDEDVEREKFCELIEFFVLIAQEELKFMSEEIQILKMKKDNYVPPPADEISAKAKMETFMITKDALQKQVFGAGYPSLPIYSLDEFGKNQAEKMARQQQQEQAAKAMLPSGGQQDQASNDPDAETEESLAKARRWDEWRDEHRIGDGNRYGKG